MTPMLITDFDPPEPRNACILSGARGKTTYFFSRRHAGALSDLEQIGAGWIFVISDAPQVVYPARGCP
ncbi:hypothetical protein RDV64_19730 [Acuticoccus sp. MNP-M23]|uniref:hypothetical protein n=1 Tax=Acuticoccus sp. MNP-M23 TaxID=3072793 RepID=UPI002815869B|nr:hypothetical protein [Acuticoccus sp. MNP-M23]WMS42269.1 hypothetical protein RDV64_19730 [Acuticoccus sp. MNP-M23]